MKNRDPEEIRELLGNLAIEIDNFVQSGEREKRKTKKKERASSATGIWRF